MKTNQPNVFMACESSYEEADLVLFGAPYDGTCSYRPGSRFAGTAIRTESFGIETYSPYLKSDLEDVSVFDGGELELPFGNREVALNKIEEYATDIVKDGKIPMMIGGEHLVTLPAVKAVLKKYENLSIIHFDAHADLREEYLGEKLSHATVLHRCYDEMKGGHIYQFGIRSMTRDEDIFAERYVTQRKYDFETLSDVVNQLGNAPVYVTIDLDVLDPSIFSGTGTPEPGGVTFKELLDAIHAMKTLNIVGCDVNELAPMLDTSGVSTLAACKAIREMILVALSNK